MLCFYGKIKKVYDKLKKNSLKIRELSKLHVISGISSNSFKDFSQKCEKYHSKEEIFSMKNKLMPFCLLV